MNDQNRNQGKFKMHLDGDIEETPAASQVDELRMEKLNQRVTMITILIPVLIVVVLIIAYLDIKQRVIRTEDTGTSGVQNLAKDMESRFSTLSLRQAKLEELLKSFSEVNNQSLAKTQVHLKKLEDRLKSMGKGLASKKDLDTRIAAINEKTKNLSAALDESSAGFAEGNQQMQKALSQMEERLGESANRINQLQEKMNKLDQEKIDKSALDVAMKLEMLKIKQSFIERLDQIDAKIKKLESKLKSASHAAPAASAPADPSPPSAPGNGQIEEQPLR
jgi:chromosome segregation ATPase